MKTSETKILAAAHDLFREYGYNGTSMKRVVEASELTTGSVYHFYPGGKVELAAAVIVEAGGAYQALFEEVLDGCATVLEGLETVFQQGGVMLVNTDYIDPCPIGGIAREVANVEPKLREACDVAFNGWIESGTQRFVAGGLDAKSARAMAMLFVTTIEGGFLLARTARDPEPFLAAGLAFCSAFKSRLAT